MPTRRFFSSPRTLGALALFAGAASLGACESKDDKPTFTPLENAPTSRVAIVLGDAPPISGGTLILLADGKTAVAADSDRDRVSIVDIVGKKVLHTVKLEKHDEPGRLVEDGSGKVHVALRRSGDVVTIDPKAGKMLRRDAVCAEPRGIAYDAASEHLYVACTGGELVTLPAAGGAAVRTLHLDKDLRDVVVAGDRLFVSRFRSAEVLTLDADGNELDRRQPGIVPIGASLPGSTDPKQIEPAVAWRMLPSPTGIIVVHQRSSTIPIPIGDTAPPSAYNSGQGVGCSTGVVQTAVTNFPSDGAAPEPGASIPEVALPVDLALSPAGVWAAIVGAGSNTLRMAHVGNLTSTKVQQCPQATNVTTQDDPIAVVFAGGGGDDGDSTAIVQTRSAGLELWGTDGTSRGNIPLGGDSVFATGHALFHHPPSSAGSLACASCHPEGRDDGRVWEFDPIGRRRTQSLAGDVAGTAPFHWGGDIADFGGLMTEVFVNRMGGDERDVHAGTVTFPDWLGTVPAPKASPATDADAVARGKALFESAETKCSSCHSGPKYTNNQTVDVGTGMPLQVPVLLGVGHRAPYMHDGCAATLHDRFGSCGGDKHGDISGLSAGDIDDLVAFLETL